MSATVIQFPKQPKPRPAGAFDPNAFIDDIYAKVTSPYRLLIQPAREDEKPR